MVPPDPQRMPGITDAAEPCTCFVLRAAEVGVEGEGGVEMYRQEQLHAGRQHSTRALAFISCPACAEHTCVFSLLIFISSLLTALLELWDLAATAAFLLCWGRLCCLVMLTPFLLPTVR